MDEENEENQEKQLNKTKYQKAYEKGKEIFIKRPNLIKIIYLFLSIIINGLFNNLL
ncbi:hypothetical protein [Oceanobacillus oncorhynchi]|uniref:hypothetical protein n=1 Tax=Oceanobacillus oncorhynchi TaxID=545501 RepID=UPI0025A31AAE|nr:hypothetical protein [Oceanobacillus oncorhynchi]MDM8101256.1 hypothetical protein [Oceanobacillus oncorhynchi]